MARNFNVKPYYDDFDSTKNYHRVLFKPGYAVQARELTQSQTILQDQITKFADNIFKQNSPVSGGQVTTNFNCYYIKLKDVYNNSAVDVTKWDGLLIQDATGTVLARVLAVSSPTGSAGVGDPPTLIVSYMSGSHFNDNDIIYDTVSNLSTQAIPLNATGKSSVASISDGVFYVLGNFVTVSKSTVILTKYSNTPSARVGLNITETIQDYIGDPTLLDPAIGASNYQAPGADRYQIKLQLETRPMELGDDDGFIELVRVTDGNVFKMIDGSVYSTIDDYFAKRDYETNGDYIVNDFKLTPKVNEDTTKYTLSVGKGLAYVRGYRVENPSPLDLVSNRARTTASQNNEPMFADYGSYFYTNGLYGVFDTSSSQQIDFHCVGVTDINTSSPEYNSTLVASGYIRGLTFDHATNDSDTSTYVYKAFVFDVENTVLSGDVSSATSNTVSFATNFSSVDDAYVGVTIQITNGPNSGEFRTISAYDGVTRTATVNTPWSVTPTTESTFSLNFDTKDIESIVTNTAGTIVSAMSIAPYGKSNGLASGYTQFNNPGVPEMLFRVGSPYVASLFNVSYSSQQVWRNISFTSAGGSVAAQLNYEGAYEGIFRHYGTPSSTLSADYIKQNFVIIVTNKGSNTLFENGDVLPWTVTGRTITTDNDSSIVTLSASDLTPFTATIIEKVYVLNADDSGYVTKFKNLIQADTTQINLTGTQVETFTFVDDTALTSTGQVYIEHTGVRKNGIKQSLYLSDVKNIYKIIDTKDSGALPEVSMINDPYYDVTANYIFDNGQRDNYYDHASITLKYGAPQPKGNLLVLLNYYQHTGGDGFFSVRSYMDSPLPENYQQIPVYTSVHGNSYSLRDCMDFRPARTNAQSSFVFRYSDAGSSKRGIYYPVDSSVMTADYTYYLGRKDKLILTKDRSIEIVEGAPSLSPIAPNEPDGSLVIANITHKPYTGFIPPETPAGFLPDLSIEKVQHRRYTMSDIAGLDTRINRVEYYTSLNSLEQSASSLQISDSYGLNRFKNGIMVDDFSSFSTADTYNNDYNSAINRRTRQLTASQNVYNFALQNLALVYNKELPSSSLLSTLSYSIGTDGYVNYFTLPYTTSNAIEQKLASRTVNINPFSVSTSEGLVALSPNVDNWVDTKYSPSLLITDPNLQVFQQSDKINVLSVGDWQTVSGTTYLSGTSQSSSTKVGAAVEGHNKNWSPFGYVGYIPTTTTTTVTNTYTTELQQQQNNILGPYSNIGNTYSLNNGFITDISILPWIRSQQIAVSISGLLIKTSFSNLFDNVNVDNYVRKGNIIELTGVTGTFKPNDVIGYYSSGVFTPTGTIMGVYKYQESGKVRLYVAGDGNTTAYTTNGKIQNAFFDGSGVYRETAASGNLLSYTVWGGLVAGVSGSNITLAPLSSDTDNYYTGMKLYINAGTGVGQSATITAYNGTTKVATLDNSISCSTSDIYSIGTFVSNEEGNFFGIFIIPENTFHTGQRVYRVDNRIGGNIGSVTTWAEGTFYAEGLSVNKQNIDFGASPSGAKGTFVQTNQQTVSFTSSSSSSTSAVSYSRWDPVAQTFIIDPDNYPNGAFLKSIKVFFASKPATDSSPVNLSIVGTLNGYPNGQTLDHSIVSLNPSQINVSSSPQYLDSSAYTEFTFKTPVYIQPNVLYAFILKSNSNEYTLWTAANGDKALASSVKNLPTDPLPSVITKISSAPYVGGLFISQNSQTWTADQNQSLMFTIQRCVFDTTKTPTVRFVVPKKLPQRKLIEQGIEYLVDSNNTTNVASTLSNSDMLIDAFNVTTTDFIPTSTNISYNYDALLVNGDSSGETNIIPGKFGTTMYDHIYLNDNKGERLLSANSDTSFSLYAQLTSTSDAVSPVISDAGTTLYAIQYNINNCELSNDLITVLDGGSNYNAYTTSVSISAPQAIGGQQAYASANIQGGIIKSIEITEPGSGYTTTPEIIISDVTGSNASVTIVGETSQHGGPAKSKYFTKKVVLDSGFDSGDLNVFVTAYRPVGTDINVYYKILNRNDTQKFDDGNWQIMTKIRSSDSLYSSTRGDLYEYVYAPGTEGFDQGYVSYQSLNGNVYTTFSQFAIKVVLTTDDNTDVPFLSDIRCIALPANVNTTV